MPAIKPYIISLLCLAVLPAVAAGRTYRGHQKVNAPIVMYNNKVTMQVATIYKYEQYMPPPQVWHSKYATWYDARMRDTLTINYGATGGPIKVRTWYIGSTGMEFYRTAVFNMADSLLEDHVAPNGSIMVTSKSDSLYLPPWGKAVYTYLPNGLIDTAVYYTAKRRRHKLYICYKYVFEYAYRTEE